MKKYRNLVVLALALGLVGCAGTQGPRQEASYWWCNAPSSLGDDAKDVGAGYVMLDIFHVHDDIFYTSARKPFACKVKVLGEDSLATHIAVVWHAPRGRWKGSIIHSKNKFPAEITFAMRLDLTHEVCGFFDPKKLLEGKFVVVDTSYIVYH